ncbi:MAG: PD-(D/E)XK nuclease domain-containing protein, partial [Calditerrivibrio sp.]|nr:PD-(D/E)XK nuclease domain-containing protein [Calditerrivibrio sp.]
ERMRYTLTYPNLEVKNSFLRLLYKSFSKDENVYTKIYDMLSVGDLDGFISVVSSIFASIPYDDGMRLNEGSFHTLFYLMVSAGGLPARSQVLNYSGRIDMVLEMRDKVYIFEFKCNQSAEVALNQIKERDYYRQYLQTGKKIYALGINFDKSGRNISEYKQEILN